MNLPPLPNIEPVELMLAAIGIKPIISREIETVTRAKLREMGGISKDVQGLARKLVRGELESASYSDLNWRQALKELARGWDIHQIADTIAKMPSEYQATGSALVLKSQQLIQALLAGFPLSRYPNLTGDIDLQPADQKLFRFASTLEMIDQPLSVFALMSTGALLKSQATAIRSAYPSLSAAIDAALLQAIIAAKAEKKSFELPPRAEYGIKSWFGKAPVDSKHLKQSQMLAALANANKPNASPPQPSSKMSGDLLTKTQRTEAAPQGR